MKGKLSPNSLSPKKRRIGAPLILNSEVTFSEVDFSRHKILTDKAQIQISGL